MHALYYGNRFGFAIFDECHHLPGEQYQYAALSSIAPFRLGLTATPERVDGKETLFNIDAYHAQFAKRTADSQALEIHELLALERAIEARVP